MAPSIYKALAMVLCIYSASVKGVYVYKVCEMVPRVGNSSTRPPKVENNSTPLLSVGNGSKALTRSRDSSLAFTKHREQFQAFTGPPELSPRICQTSRVVRRISQTSRAVLNIFSSVRNSSGRFTAGGSGVRGSDDRSTPHTFPIHLRRLPGGHPALPPLTQTS